MGVAVRVIPCLDVAEGRVVKGVNFLNLKDAGDPVELARLYDSQGADEIAFLDVSATVGGRGTLLDVVRRTAEEVFVPLTVGGLIRVGGLDGPHVALGLDHSESIAHDCFLLVVDVRGALVVSAGFLGVAPGFGSGAGADF